MPKPAFQFVDNIRCLAMISIVVEHAFFLGSYTYSPDASPYWYYLTGLQLVKFGTIAFFIIAGFLFAQNHGNHPFFEYLKRRLDNILKPWVVWASVFLILLVGIHVVRSMLDGIPANLIKSSVWWGVKVVFLRSNYWFIINFFFCTTVMLLSTRFMHKLGYGLFLLGCTSFYAVNIYTEWISPLHTTAIGGFVFFYWLGVQLNLRRLAFEKFLQKIPAVAIFLLITLTAWAGVLEADYLSQLKKIDPINTLRASNILFSLSVFLLFFKIRNLAWLNFLEPRKTTYGIFLIHYILVYHMLPIILGGVAENYVQTFSPADLLKFQISRFLLVYISSLVVVKMLVRSQYAWLVGIPSVRKADNVEPELIPVKAPERNIALETEAA